MPDANKIGRGFKEIEASANDLSPVNFFLYCDTAGMTATIVDHDDNTEEGVVLPQGIMPMNPKKITAIDGGKIYMIHNNDDQAMGS